MKIVKLIFVSLVAMCIFFAPVLAQKTTIPDSTGLPGDDFSLQGTLELFEKAASPEAFEKAINEQNNNVNNLDLNGDGKIDYVKVIDKTQDEVHAFILQVPVSETENQDIAVIEIEKTGKENAILQIIGDEDIYGETIIVEPNEGAEEDAAYLDNFNTFKTGGPSAGDAFNARPIIVNVWYWPCVSYIYRPAYRPWVSPWAWHRYPPVWRPWKPYVWHAWYPRRHIYYNRPYAVVHTHRVAHAHRVYTPVRITSVTVKKRNTVAMNKYKVTRIKNTVTGPGGNTRIRKTTTVKGYHGKVKAKNTRVYKTKG